MDEHDGPAHSPALLQRIAEVEIVVILQSHAAKDDQIDLGLHGDAGKQLVVWLAADTENRELLALDQRVEDVDHRNTGPDHGLRSDTLGRVDRWAADGDHVVGQGRTLVPRFAGTIEDATKQRVRIGDLHGMPEEADFVPRGDTLGSGEHLQADQVMVELDDVGVAVAQLGLHDGKVIVPYSSGVQRDDVADNGFNFRINLLHHPTP